ncbi:acetylcholinesterase-like isoform X2 [Paramacrobiotus metropolitanus]|uniref:acetylcholinesterase-like isoform X2 n=1 Tax=Paramacrobiotus metropolitanus TaxID=2943436 RepID=UPI002445C874|nr:acetylcholinesterase-like isoform X2 [Paramacrobiotus metropolitanus]
MVQTIELLENGSEWKNLLLSPAPAVLHNRHLRHLCEVQHEPTMSRLSFWLLVILVKLTISSDVANETDIFVEDGVNDNRTARPERTVDENEVIPEVHTVEDLTLVNTTLGYVRGRTVTTANGKSVDVYLGVPFAEPPVGPLRFKKPVPKKPWEGIYDAWNQPNSCMQLIDTYLGDFVGATKWNANTPLSEDCLYLNIWVPRPRPTNAPVLVWIFGGGFFAGSITLDIYNGSILASEENVIFVSMQYRLGPFGFLYFGTEEAPGNQGLFDQLLALKWIQQNIEHFGGHAKYVTLFGESAGAACVGLHLMSNLSSDLFMQAVLQSGSPTADWAHVSTATALNRSADFAHRLDCQTESVEHAVHCLRQIEAQTLIDDIPATGNLFDYYFIPVVDGDFLTRDPMSTLRYQQFKKTNIMLGVTANEGTAFLMYMFPELFQLYQVEMTIKRSDFKDVIFKLFPNMSTTATEALIFQYTNWISPDETSSLVENLEKIIGDKCITCEVNQLAQAYAASGAGVFLYEFSHRSSNSPWPHWMGSQHTHEMDYVFGHPLNEKLNFSSSEQNLAKSVMSYWANFARTGNPSLLPNGQFSKRFWPVYTANGKEYLQIFEDSQKVRHGLRAQYCAFWKQYLPHLTKTLQEMEVAAVPDRTAPFTILCAF